jgi:hypothetical protein
VRQEEIAPPLANKDDYDADTWRGLKKDYKDKLERSVKTHWGNIRIDRKSDLYVYFYYHGLALLRPGGVFCFINSNSWLDVGYGAGLQDFLLRNMKVLQIIDNHSERSFARADVNTVIVLIQRPRDEERKSIWDNVVRFVAYKKPFEEVIKPENQRFIEETNGEVRAKEELRVYPVTQKGLFLEGVEMVGARCNVPLLDFDSLENLEYGGGKWGGKYLRAPDIFFTILEKGKGKLVRLGDIAEVETYLNTGGADGFFFVKDAGGNEKVRLIRNDSKEGQGRVFDLDTQFVRPFIKSPDEIHRLIIKPSDAKWLLVVLPNDEHKLTQRARNYIRWGEFVGFHQRSGCRNRQPWWKLPPQSTNPGRLIWNRAHNDRHIVPFNQNQVAYTNFYAIWVDIANEQLVGAILNSTLFVLIRELMGRVNFGGGALKTDGVDIKKFPILKIELYSSLSKYLLNSFNRLAQREVQSIFEELGFTLCHKKRNECKHLEHPYELVNPSGVSLDKVMPDRRELDRVVFEALGLTEKEQIEVYRAVVELVKNRLVKARSV